MSDDTLAELLAGWKEETVTTKHAIDQLLRHLRTLHEQVRALERGLAASPPPARRETSLRSADFTRCKEGGRGGAALMKFDNQNRQP